ncbi:MAG: PEP/pyruvate-binding domain-containing protein [Desulfobulbaceae bacterium]
MLNILNRIALQFIAPGEAIRAKYHAFKELLHHDRVCHKRLAELEELYYQNRKVDLNLIRRLHSDLSAGVSAMVGCLERMAPASYISLRVYAGQIEYYGRIALTPLASFPGSSTILPLAGSYPDDLRIGGKGLHLCQLKQHLGLPVPEGFIVSTSAFHYFLEVNNLRPRINSLLSHVDIKSDRSLSATATQLMRMVEEAEIPERLAAEIRNSVAALAKRTGAERFAVRSSAVGEDSAISFAGQYDSVLSVGADRLPAACKKVFAGKYSAKAIYYRINAGLLDEDTPMAVLVLEMIDARLSGVVISGGDAGSAGEGVVIHSIEGLGDKLVGGRCTPETVVVRPTGDGFRVARSPPPAAPAGSHKQQAAPAEEDGRPALSVTDEQALQLAAWARQIEQWYQTPQEIEWSLAPRGDLFLLQARPMLIREKSAEAGQLDTSGFPVLIAGGETASRGAACGPVYRIEHEGQLADVPAGAVLVTAVTPPSYVLALERVCAVVAEQGSAADHFASVAREAGVPVLVKAAGAGMVLSAGRVVTVCADLGQVFAGCIEIILNHYPRQRIEQQDSPVHQAFARASQFIFPLQLVNPGDPSFTPDNCRSLHDLIRFVHEKGVQAMFSQAATMFARRSTATLLKAPIPLQIYLLDMDADTGRTSEHEAALNENDMRSAPLQAVLRGLTHPGIIWHHPEHFDWKNFSEVTMAGGIVSSSDPAFASYAVVAEDYLNLNMRFGYHFVILDSLCGEVAEDNYIKLRFAGGGGDPAGKALRLAFIAEILRRLGFSVQTGGDLLDGQLMRYTHQIILEKLDLVGRLLAATTLMDMVIRDENMVDRMVAGFMNEDYDFSRAGEG